MKNQYARKVDKIYKRIDKIASTSGLDGLLEYKVYIDEIIQKGEYAIFMDVLDKYYSIETSNFDNVRDVKDKTWNDICFGSNSQFLNLLKKLYDRLGVYQQSYFIYRQSDNQILGELLEEEIYSEDARYFVKNKMYARLVGEKRPRLIIRYCDCASLDVDSTLSKIYENCPRKAQEIFSEYLDNNTYLKNQINQYEAAITALLNNYCGDII
jgi:thymidylate synthase ThyX